MSSILKVSTLQDPTNSNTAMSINSSGIVTTPQRPFIQLFSDASTTYAANATITDFRVHNSRGITFSSGVITVPVDGLYQIGINIIAYTDAGVYVEVNNTRINRIGYADQGTSETWSGVSGDCIFNLNANDEVKFTAENAITIYGTNTNSTVGGAYVYLVG